MRRPWNKLIRWGVWLAVVLGAGSCRPQEVVVERTATQIVIRPSEPATSTAVVTVERTILVTEQETVQVVVTSIPTPIPDGGFVTRTTFTDASSANPVLASDPASRAFCDLMFEGLLRVDSFTGVWVPNFAEGWTVSDDGLTYTFAIRKGLQWSDGKPITARDFYFTYLALMSGALDTPNTRYAAGIEELAILDDHSIAVTFSQADCSNLEHLQLGWIPAHVFTDNIETYDYRELAMHEFNGSPTVFSGPFMLRDWERGDHWTQVRNENYWRGRPHLDGIVTQVSSGQSALVEMLKSGEVDVGIDIQPRYLAELELDPDLQILRFMSDGYDFIGFQLGDPNDPQPRLNEDGTLNEKHGEHPILGDSRVRRAIVYALDRREIIAQARLGQGIPLHANVLPVVSWAYNADLEPREHDPERAGQLLEEAGWVMNEETGIRQRNGAALELRLHTNAGNEVRETIGALVREQLHVVGIQVELIAVEWYAFLDVLYGQTFDMALVSWSNLEMNPDDGDLWSAQNDVPGRGSNFVSYSNPELEVLLAEARSLPGCDQQARAERYRQIQAQIYEDQPYCWLDVPRNLVAINRRVGGVNPGPWSLWYNTHEWYIVE